MAGPIIEAIRNRLGDDEDDQIIKVSDSPLIERHRGQILKEMDSAGGCCGAAAAARTVRDDDMKFE